jgi:hypothetical protein
MEVSFKYYFVEKIIKANEPMLMSEDFNMKKLEKERIKLVYDHMCWNYKLMGTQKFFCDFRNIENYYTKGGNLGEMKCQRINLMNWIRKLVFTKKLKDYLKETKNYLLQEILLKENQGRSIIKIEAMRRKKKKRIKFREKLKQRKTY